jgi:hypothetical protein
MHERDGKCIPSLSENLKGGDHLRDIGVDEGLIMKWIL